MPVMDGNLHTSLWARLKTLRGSPVLMNGLIAYSVQAFRLASPFVLAFVLARRLGPGAFGQILVAQSIAAYAALVIDFGLQLSTVRRISISRDETSLRAAVSEAMLARATTAIISTVVAVPLLLMVHESIQISAALMILSWLYGLAQSSIPHWYFQGVQKIKFSAVPDLIGQLTAIAAILLLVQDPDDGYLVIAVQALGSLAAGALTTFLMVREARPYLASIRAVANTLKAAFPLFVTRTSIALYTLATPIILTLHTSATQAAIYMAADKIVTGCSNFYAPVAQFFMPHISNTIAQDAAKAFRHFWSLTGVAVALGAALALFISLTAPFLFGAIFGHAFDKSAVIGQLTAWLIPLGGLNQLLAFSLLVPLGKEWTVNIALALAGAITVLLAGFATGHGGIYGFAVLRVGVELAISIALLSALASKSRPRVA